MAAEKTIQELEEGIYLLTFEGNKPILTPRPEAAKLHRAFTKYIALQFPALTESTIAEMIEDYVMFWAGEAEES